MGRRLAGSRGSIFVDVVVTLLIAGTALLITLGGIALTARASRNAAARAFHLIEVRNENARSQKHTFARDLIPE
jgi:hypothetical protein